MLNMPLLFYHSIKNGTYTVKGEQNPPGIFDSGIGQICPPLLSEYILHPVFSSELPKFHPGTIQKSESRRYINGISFYAMTDYSSRLL